MDRAWGGWFVAALRSVKLRWSWNAWLTHIPGRVMLAVGWELCGGDCQPGASAPPHTAAQASSQHGGCVLRASAPSCTASSDLALEIMPHHFCLILLINPAQIWAQPKFKGTGIRFHFIIRGRVKNSQPCSKEFGQVG